MTAEFGPRDVDLSLMERIAAHATRYTTWLLSDLTNPSLTYNPKHATLSLSGESEDSGNGYARGVLVGMLYLHNVVLALGAIVLAGEAASVVASVGAIVGTIVGVVSLFVMFASALVGWGSVKLMAKTDVIDHTTEPLPEALDDLQQQYVDGEIDESELAAAVEREVER